MLITQFLQKRKSVRDFKPTAIDKYEMDAIKDAVAAIDAEENGVFKFLILENGKVVSEGLKGKAGYSGVMIEAPHYVALSTVSETMENRLKVGYGLEKLNTKIIDLGLDTCWITVDEVDASTMRGVFGEGGERIHFLIAFGHGKGKKLFSKETTSSRMPVQEVVFEATYGNPVSLDTLENRGLLDIFSTLIYAPSHKNLQPWRFVIRDAGVDLYMVHTDEDLRSLIDMGVVSFYFEELVKTNNMNGKWTISFHDEGDKLRIGTFTL
ncbi:nitroreductase [Peptoniphilus equinus]|uniref:Nitroreductase n=1 Tax=Peptoniphilus equinus TaxID=3016343 RepID=A0ABY7QTY6_9FIRM|nr:nitroreductase family protein [Peptoniphilus equinus]WBW49480.1 nitroreductase [Peptoniphilus equinus]